MSEVFHEMDEKEIEWVMNKFIYETHAKYLRKVLNSFAEKRGYSYEYIYIWFYYDDEDSDEKLRMLDEDGFYEGLSELDDKIDDLGQWFIKNKQEIFNELMIKVNSLAL